MRDVSIGDVILVDNKSNTYSKVYSFGHFSRKTETLYLSILVDKQGTSPLEISPEHLIYKYDSAMKKKTLVPARNIAVGDLLLGVDATAAEVQSIQKVIRHGAYSPLTASGEIIVSGVLASNYVTRESLHEDLVSGQFLHWLQHGAVLPYCLFCSVVGCEKEVYDENTGFSPWVEFWFRLEQWHLGLPRALQALVLSLLAAPMFFIVMLGKFSTDSWTVLIGQVLVAVVSYLYLKKLQRSGKDKLAKKE